MKFASVFFSLSLSLSFSFSLRALPGATTYINVVVNVRVYHYCFRMRRARLTFLPLVPSSRPKNRRPPCPTLAASGPLSLFPRRTRIEPSLVGEICAARTRRRSAQEKESVVNKKILRFLAIKFNWGANKISKASLLISLFELGFVPKREREREREKKRALF